MIDVQRIIIEVLVEHAHSPDPVVRRHALAELRERDHATYLHAAYEAYLTEQWRENVVAMRALTLYLPPTRPTFDVLSLGPTC